MISIIYTVLSLVLNLYRWAVILAAVMSTLVSFGVLDTRNRLVYSIGEFFFRITEPALRPIRNALPRLGSIDLSPLVLILLIFVAQMLLDRIYAAIEFGNMQGLVL